MAKSCKTNGQLGQKKEVDKILEATDGGLTYSQATDVALWINANVAKRIEDPTQSSFIINNKLVGNESRLPQDREKVTKFINSLEISAKEKEDLENKYDKWVKKMESKKKHDELEANKLKIANKDKISFFNKFRSGIVDAIQMEDNRFERDSLRKSYLFLFGRQEPSEAEKARNIKDGKPELWITPEDANGNPMINVDGTPLRINYDAYKKLITRYSTDFKINGDKSWNEMKEGLTLDGELKTLKNHIYNSLTGLFTSFDTGIITEVPDFYKKAPKGEKGKFVRVTTKKFQSKQGRFGETEKEGFVDDKVKFISKDSGEYRELINGINMLKAKREMLADSFLDESIESGSTIPKEERKQFLANIQELEDKKFELTSSWENLTGDRTDKPSRIINFLRMIKSDIKMSKGDVQEARRKIIERLNETQLPGEEFSDVAIETFLKKYENSEEVLPVSETSSDLAGNPEVAKLTNIETKFASLKRSLDAYEGEGKRNLQKDFEKFEAIEKELNDKYGKENIKKLMEDISLDEESVERNKERLGIGENDIEVFKKYSQKRLRISETEYNEAENPGVEIGDRRSPDIKIEKEMKQVEEDTLMDVGVAKYLQVAEGLNPYDAFAKSLRFDAAEKLADVSGLEVTNKLKRASEDIREDINFGDTVNPLWTELRKIAKEKQQTEAEELEKFVPVSKDPAVEVSNAFGVMEKLETPAMAFMKASNKPFNDNFYNSFKRDTIMDESIVRKAGEKNEVNTETPEYKELLKNVLAERNEILSEQEAIEQATRLELDTSSAQKAMEARDNLDESEKYKKERAAHERAKLVQMKDFLNRESKPLDKFNDQKMLMQEVLRENPDYYTKNSSGELIPTEYALENIEEIKKEVLNRQIAKTKEELSPLASLTTVPMLKALPDLATLEKLADKTDIHVLSELPAKLSEAVNIEATFKKLENANIGIYEDLERASWLESTKSIKDAKLNKEEKQKLGEMFVKDSAISSAEILKVNFEDSFNSFVNWTHILKSLGNYRQPTPEQINTILQEISSKIPGSYVLKGDAYTKGFVDSARAEAIKEKNFIEISFDNNAKEQIESYDMEGKMNSVPVPAINIVKIQPLPGDGMQKFGQMSMARFKGERINVKNENIIASAVQDFVNTPGFRALAEKSGKSKGDVKTKGGLVIPGLEKESGKTDLQKFVKKVVSGIEIADLYKSFKSHINANEKASHELRVKNHKVNNELIAQINEIEPGLIEKRLFLDSSNKEDRKIISYDLAKLNDFYEKNNVYDFDESIKERKQYANAKINAQKNAISHVKVLGNENGTSFVGINDGRSLSGRELRTSYDIVKDGEGYKVNFTAGDKLAKTYVMKVSEKDNADLIPAVKGALEYVGVKTNNARELAKREIVKNIYRLTLQRARQILEADSYDLAAKRSKVNTKDNPEAIKNMLNDIKYRFVEKAKDEWTEKRETDLDSLRKEAGRKNVSVEQAEKAQRNKQVKKMTEEIENWDNNKLSASKQFTEAIKNKFGIEVVSEDRLNKDKHLMKLKSKLEYYNNPKNLEALKTDAIFAMTNDFSAQAQREKFIEQRKETINEIMDTVEKNKNLDTPFKVAKVLQDVSMMFTGEQNALYDLVSNRKTTNFEVTPELIKNSINYFAEWHNRKLFKKITGAHMVGVSEEMNPNIMREFKLQTEDIGENTEGMHLLSDALGIKEWFETDTPKDRAWIETKTKFFRDRIKTNIKAIEELKEKMMLLKKSERVPMKKEAKKLIEQIKADNQKISAYINVGSEAGEQLMLSLLNAKVESGSFEDSTKSRANTSKDPQKAMEVEAEYWENMAQKLKGESAEGFVEIAEALAKGENLPEEFEGRDLDAEPGEEVDEADGRIAASEAESEIERQVAEESSTEAANVEGEEFDTLGDKEIGIVDKMILGREKEIKSIQELEPTDALEFSKADRLMKFFGKLNLSPEIIRQEKIRKSMEPESGGKTPSTDVLSAIKHKPLVKHLLDIGEAFRKKGIVKANLSEAEAVAETLADTVPASQGKATGIEEKNTKEFGC